MDQQDRDMLKSYLAKFKGLSRDEIIDQMYGAGNYHEIRVKAGEIALAALDSDKRDLREEATLVMAREANEFARSANAVADSANALAAEALNAERRQALWAMIAAVTAVAALILAIIALVRG